MSRREDHVVFDSSEMDEFRWAGKPTQRVCGPHGAHTGAWLGVLWHGKGVARCLEHGRSVDTRQDLDDHLGRSDRWQAPAVLRRDGQTDAGGTQASQRGREVQRSWREHVTKDWFEPRVLLQLC